MKAKTLYPEYEGGYGPCNYQPIIDDLGTVLVQVDDNDYQGDSRVLLQKDSKFGILIFGWGSCSGCDSLEDLEKEIEHIQSSTKWFDSVIDCLHYLDNHDWEGDYCWHREETKDFLEKAKSALLSL